jgi:hypothetical protein
MQSSSSTNEIMGAEWFRSGRSVMKLVTCSCTRNIPKIYLAFHAAGLTACTGKIKESSSQVAVEISLYRSSDGAKRV